MKVYQTKIVFFDENVELANETIVLNSSNSIARKDLQREFAIRFNDFAQYKFVNETKEVDKVHFDNSVEHLF